MKHLFITLIISLLSTVTAVSAPTRTPQKTTAKINRIWIETGTVRDGKNGITIHADIDLDDAKGRQIGCQAMFYNMPGGWSLRDKNGQYRVSPHLNYVAAFHFFRSDKQTELGRNDIAVFIPIEELHIKGNHKYRIYTQLSLYADPGRNGVFLAESDYYPVVIDQTKKDNFTAYVDNTAPVSVAEAKAMGKANKNKAIVPVDKAKKKTKKEKENKKKEKQEKAKSKRSTRNSTVKKDEIDPATFWEKEEIDSLSLPRLYIE